MVRILFDAPARFVDTDQFQKLDRTFLGLGLGHIQMRHHGLGQLQADRQNRVQRGHRFLEDHGDVAAANFPNLVLGAERQVLALEADFTADDLAGRLRDQTQNAERGNGFPRTGLAHDGDGFTGVDVVRYAVNSFNGSPRRKEMRLEIINLEECPHRMFPSHCF